MKPILLAICLLVARIVSGATGTVLWSDIDTNGWVMRVCLDTTVTNGNFNFGWATNNSGASAIQLLLTSLGFDDTGIPITVQRTIQGTIQLRLAYPANSNNDVTISAVTNVIARVALSDYIYSSDSNITVSIAAGWYQSNPAISVLSMTNGSVALYQSCIANWSYPGWQAITNNTMTLRAVGFHRSAQQGRPLRVMRFVATDQSSHSVTNFVTNMTIDSRMPDANPIPEYVADMDISSLTQADLIRCDFAAYPWIGDAGSVQDTGDNVNSNGPNYRSMTNLCDRLLTFGSSYAIVATNGVDATGVVGTNSMSPTWVAPYLTIGRALDGLHRTNAVWFGASRSNAANSIIYLTQGNYEWIGLNTFTGDKFPMPPPIITPWISNTIADCVLIRGNNCVDAGRRFTIRNLSCLFTNASGFCAPMDFLWLDRCYIDTVATGLLNGTTNGFTTQCVVTNWPGGYNTAGTAPTLIRGNLFANTNVDFRFRTYTQIGNRRARAMPSAGTTQLITTSLFGVVPEPDRAICAYNSFLGISVGSSAMFQFYDSNDSIKGGAYVQNLIENINTNQQALVYFSVVCTNSTNVLIWHSNFSGDGSELGYNDLGSVPRWRNFWSVKNNLFDRCYIKTDWFQTANAGRTGNWAVVFGVGHSADLDCGVIGHTASFTNEFAGLNSLSADLNQTNWFGFINPQASLLNQGIQFGGFGNYRVTSDSPVRFFPAESLIPFDLGGNNRGNLDPPGAYSSASPRKGAGFF